MNQYVTGATIKELRERKNMTQADLAKMLAVSDKAVSKWETGKGYPDITLLEPLARALDVSITELISGNTVVNTNVSANMTRCKFYVCPVCGNIIASTGEASVSCHGVELMPLEAEEAEKVEGVEGVEGTKGAEEAVRAEALNGADALGKAGASDEASKNDAADELGKIGAPGESSERHAIRVERVEDEFFAQVEHPMTKLHYISFLAAVSPDRVQLVKTYPESSAQARFKIDQVSTIYAYCNKDGLFKTSDI